MYASSHWMTTAVTTLLVVAGSMLNAPLAMAEDTTWRSQKISSLFHGEGGTLADLDGDGHMDIAAGYMLFFGPEFAQGVPIHPAQPYNINGYSEYFFDYDYDIDGDGDRDILIIGFPGAAAHWYRNPGKDKCRAGAWERFVVMDVVDNESPTFADITGDGRPEVICCTGGKYGFAEIPADPTQPWNFHPTSEPGPYQRFTHGMGVGDVNDDGHSDLMAKNGWWENPGKPQDAAWTFHEFEFSGPGGAQMYAVDLDRDGKTEIVTSLAAHGFGLVVYKKSTSTTGPAWIRQDIMTDKADTSPTGLAISQLHAIDIADMDGDSHPDIVTGKRFWAHNGNDAGENEPPMLVWFKPVVVAGGLKFEPNIIDDDSGVGTQILVRDADGDGRMDVLSVSKRGVHLLTQIADDSASKPAHPRDVAGSVATASVSIDDALGGFRPAWSVSSKGSAPANSDPAIIELEAMNVDFETGDLRDWTARGGAFFNQPIQGDAVRARRKDMASNHQGQYWIGSYEVGGDVAMGTMTSRPFRVTHPWISFLLAGGSGNATGCELIDVSDGLVLQTMRGGDTETLKRAVINAQEWMNKTIAIRLIDNGREGWGHVNFDDFRMHDTEPNIPAADRIPVVDVLQHSSLPANRVAESMTLPDGFRVQVMASEPDVRQPIAMTIDHRNRVWIAEAYTYPNRAEGDVGKDRVLIFEDTDLDGVLDSHKVFAEGLNLVSGIEVGFGGLWVGAAPYLLFIPDKNGDDIPDGPPVRKLDGWGYQDTHETLNSFIWGPDGWLYGCHGVFTHSRVGIVGSDGSTQPDNARIGINAGIWRYHPVHERFEVFAHGTSNPWGVDFDDVGQAFLTACVIPHLYHIIPNARYQRQAGSHFNRFTYDDIQTIALHRHWIGDNPHAGNNRSDSAGGGHAHSGAMIYLGGAWPDRYRNQLFMNNIHGARLNQDQLKRRGSGYVGDRAPDFLLANDRSSQILYFRCAADGQVVAIDWYDAQQCHTNDPANHDTSNGRVYRISYNHAKPVAVDLSHATDLELAEYQTHTNDWYCRTARRLLAERAAIEPLASEAVQRLEAIASTGETRVRLRGMWTLAACGVLNPALHQALLRDRDEDILGWAIRWASPRSVASRPLRTKTSSQTSATVPTTLLDSVSALRDTASPRVRLALASVCQDLTVEQALPILKGLLKHTEDEQDHNLPLMVWYAASRCLELEPNCYRELLAESKMPSVSRRLVRQRTEMAIEASESDVPAQLQALLVGIRGADPLAAASLMDEVLKGLEKKRTLPTPKDWTAFRNATLDQGDADQAERVLLLAAKFNDTEALDTIAKNVARTELPEQARMDALRILRQVKAPQVRELAMKLLAQPAMRSAAVAALGDGLDRKTGEQILAMALKWEQPQDRRAAWYVLVRRADTAGMLLQAIGNKTIPANELSADMVQQIQRLDAPDLVDTVRKVWGTVRTRSEDRTKDAEKIQRIVSVTNPESDIANGKALYAKSCGQCHILFGEGGKIGPELTGSNRRDLNYLLENILDPSAVMAREYQPMIVLTTEGQTLTGLLRAENADSIRLQTATEELVVYREDIEQMKQSELSMMPADLLSPMNENEIRDLIAYLRSNAGRSSNP